MQKYHIIHGRILTEAELSDFTNKLKDWANKEASGPHFEDDLRRTGIFPFDNGIISVTNLPGEITNMIASFRHYTLTMKIERKFIKKTSAEITLADHNISKEEIRSAIEYITHYVDGNVFDPVRTDYIPYHDSINDALDALDKMMEEEKNPIKMVKKSSV